MLNWVNQFNICCFLDNHQYHFQPSTVECLVGAGSLDTLEAQAGSAFDKLHDFFSTKNDWLFGHLSYDLKNETENLSSSHPDHIGFPDLFFFVPEVVVELTTSYVRIGLEGDNHKVVWNDIASTSTNTSKPAYKGTTVRNRFTRSEYISTVTALKEHILRGDCYEINFCQEFYAEDLRIDPMTFFHSLSEISPNPFAAYYRVDDKYLLCASPERYLQKKGRKVVSQPIKGTSKRDQNNAEKDLENKKELFTSAKDRSENVMVVDLVRNDLSRVCEEGSVQVDELFGVYSFPQVHQMISTVSGTLKSDMDWLKVLKATFPMGSMTGAPKTSVLKLIERYEKSKRGIFSGAVGYISPHADFDFNVVIRSVLYNSSKRYLSFPAGSGITFYSDPELEYEECLLKAKAIKDLLLHKKGDHFHDPL